MPKELWIYLVELEPQKDPHAAWYVGITDDPERRVREHRQGRGAVWTARNKVVEMCKVGKAEERYARAVEHRLTKYMMRHFGIQAVRGGKWTSPDAEDLPEVDLNDAAISPVIADALRCIDHPTIQSLQPKGQVNLSVQDEITFRDWEIAREWAKTTLPKGTEITLQSPVRTTTERVLADQIPY